MEFEGLERWVGEWVEGVDVWWVVAVALALMSIIIRDSEVYSSWCMNFPLDL